MYLHCVHSGLFGQNPTPHRTQGTQQVHLRAHAQSSASAFAGHPEQHAARGHLLLLPLGRAQPGGVPCSQARRQHGLDHAAAAAAAAAGAAAAAAPGRKRAHISLRPLPPPSPRCGPPRPPPRPPRARLVGAAGVLLLLPAMQHPHARTHAHTHRRTRARPLTPDPRTHAHAPTHTAPARASGRRTARAQRPTPSRAKPSTNGSSSGAWSVRPCVSQQRGHPGAGRGGQQLEEQEQVCCKATGEGAWTKGEGSVDRKGGAYAMAPHSASVGCVCCVWVSVLGACGAGKEGTTHIHARTHASPGRTQAHTHARARCRSALPLPPTRPHQPRQ